MSATITKHITKIIHIADLHIRTGNKDAARYKEYKAVLQRIVADLACYPPVKEGKAIVIIAGDVFHHKLKIESPGIKLILKFLLKLAELARVYIIRGNHDYRQDFPHEPDLIESLLSIDIPGVTYLASTGHYKIDNVGVGLVAIQDALHSGNTCGRVVELPGFPSASFFDDDPNIKTRIALFHGSIVQKGAGNSHSGNSHSGYPLEWFKGYDAVMLGDIHMQQANNCTKENALEHATMFENSSLIDTYSYRSGRDKDNESNIPWIYAGSTLQQDFGEALYGHGFAIWDIDDRTVEFYHVHNHYGFVTLNHDTRSNTYKLIDKTRSLVAYHNIIDYIRHHWFPKRIALRIMSNDRTSQHNSVIDLFAENNIDIGKLVVYGSGSDDKNQKDEGINEVDGQESAITNFNSIDTWIEYVASCTPFSQDMDQDHDKDKNNWKSWFHNPETLAMTPPCNIDIDIEGIATRNNRIAKKIADFQKTRESNLSFTSKRRVFSISYLKWDYILCFGKGSYFNFDNLQGKIINISARNGMGKTSFLETICIALYGEGFPSRSNKAFSAAFISHTKPKNSHACTSIILNVASSNYRINRKFGHHSADANKIHCIPRDITVEEQVGDGVWKNIHSGKTAVDSWVNNNIGTLNSFLLSCMVTQNSDMDFFHLKANEQRDLLDDALDINDSTEFHAVLKEAKLAHSAICEIVQGVLSSLKPKQSGKDHVIMKAELDGYERVLKEARTQLANLPRINLSRDEEDAIRNAASKEDFIGDEGDRNRERGCGIMVDTIESLRESIMSWKAELAFPKETKYGVDGCGVGSLETDVNNTDIEYCSKHCKKLEEWHASLEKLEERKHDIESSLLKVTEAGHPFNPDCWACCKQPWKVQEMAWRSKVTEIVNGMQAIHTKAARLSKLIFSDDEGHLKEEYHNMHSSSQVFKIIIKLTEHIQILKYREWCDRKATLETMIHQAQEKLDMISRNAFRAKCFDIYDVYFERIRSKEKLEREILDLNINISLLKKEYQDALKQTENYDELHRYYVDLVKRCDVLANIYDIFGGFKAWLYKEKIVPFLQTSANNIMSVICEDRPLMLESTVTHSSIHWFIRDGDVAPPIEKASGFQRFIAGLAFRLALGEIKFKAQSSQLFLDEGFTACDSDNLGRVGAFLENLPFFNIIIVSHLDEVKTCAHGHIFIERDEKAVASKIRFGEYC